MKRLSSRPLRARYGHMAPAALKPDHGFEFKFYAKDRGEPPHVHVYKNGRKIKFWLGPPVALGEPANSKALKSFKSQEVRRAREIIEEKRAEIHRKWVKFFA